MRQLGSVPATVGLLMCAGPLLHAQLEPAFGSLSFTVVNAATKAPVPDALVVLSGAGKSPAVVAVADVTGRVRFERLEPGWRSVRGVEAPGYKMSGVTSTTVKPGEHIDGGTLALIPLGAISGRVVDDLGRPLSGVKVEALVYQAENPSTGLPPSTTTDDRGQFRIHSLDAGRYHIRATLSEYHEWVRLLQLQKPPRAVMPTFYPGVTTQQEAVALNLTPGGQLFSIDVQLRPNIAVEVSGTVTGRVNRGSSHLMLQSCPEGGQGGLFSILGKVGEDGSFKIVGVPPGRHCVVYGEYRLYPYDMQLFASEMVNVTAENVMGIRLDAVPAVKVTGSWKAEVPDTSAGIESTPRFRGEAHLIPLNPAVLSAFSGSYSDTRQSFDYGTLPPGEYELRIYSDTGAYVKKILLGDEEVQNARVRLAGVSAEFTLVTDRPLGRIMGRVTDTRGNNPEGMMVTLSPTGGLSRRGDLIRRVNTGKNGVFTITDIAPGTYKLLAWEKYDAALVRRPDFLALFLGKEIKLEKNDPANFDSVADEAAFRARMAAGPGGAAGPGAKERQTRRAADAALRANVVEVLAITEAEFESAKRRVE